MATLDQELDSIFPQEGTGKAQTTALDGELDQIFGGAEALSPVSEGLDISDTLERGGRTLAGNLITFLGDPELGEQVIQAAPQANLASFRDIQGVGDVGAFIGERTLESVPSTSLSILGGIAGGFITGGPIGALIGAGLATAPTLIGEAQREVIEGGGEGTIAQGAPAGLANTALEMFPVTKVAKAMGLNKLFKDTGKEIIEENAEVVEGIMAEIGRRGKDVGEIALTEGSVEALQELNNKFNERFMNSKEVLALDEADRNDLLESFVGGLAGGTGIGTAANVVGAGLDRLPGSPRARADETPEEHEVRKEIREILRGLDQADNIIETTAARFDEKGTAPKIFPGIVGATGTRVGPIGQTATSEGPNSGSIFGHHIRGKEDVLQHQKIQEMPVFGGLDENGEVLMARRGDPNEEGVDNIATSIFGNVAVKEITDDGKTVFHEFSSKDMTQKTDAFVREALAAVGITDMRLSVMDENNADVFSDGIKDTTWGHFFRGEQTGSIIGMNAQAIADRSATLQEFEGQFFEVLSHELGHAIINHQWQEIGGGIGNPKKGKVYKALIQGYREWLRDMDQLTNPQFQKKYQTPFSWNAVFKLPSHKKLNRLQALTRTFSGMSNPQSAAADHIAYQLSFDEYAAQQFAMVMTGRLQKGDFSPEVQGFFQETFDRLQKLWKAVKKHFAPEQSFEAWANLMMGRQALKEARERAEQLGVPHKDLQPTANQVEEEVEASIEEPAETPDFPEKIAPEASLMGDIVGRFGLREAEEQVREHNGVVMGFMRLAKALTPIQIADLIQKHGIDQPKRYMDLVREYANTKMKQIEIADGIAQEWRALGRERNSKLGNFLFAVSDRSDREERRLTPDELREMKEQMGLDEETFQMWRDIDKSFGDVLENIERGLILDAAKSFIQDAEQARNFRDAYMALSDDASRLELIERFTGLPAIPDLTVAGDIQENPLKTELDRIQKSVDKLKARNYFPRSRLGQYTIVIKATAEGQVWEGHEADAAGQTLGFYAFDTKKERDAALKAMQRDALSEGLSIVGSKMDSEVFAMMGMPEVLIQKIANSPEMNLTDEQREQLKQVSLNLSPGKKFLKHLKKRRGIAGFSEDAMRVYVTYMMSAANHLARVEHSKSMAEVLQEMDGMITDRLREGQGEIIDDLVNMKDYFRRHFDYLMKPDNDWANLRAVGFLWYLGFNVKSALVNLTQIPMVTYPVMAGRFGDEKSLKQISKAYSSVTKWIRGKEGALNAEEEALLQEFREAGIIDESMVMELAGLGEGDILKRTLPGWKLDNTLSKVSYYGGMMFRLGEKYNRLVTAVAGYRAAREAGQEPEAAARTAREIIEQSQFEYAKWNRPEFMRGKKSVIFLFWQYMQHASFLFAGGAGQSAPAGATSLEKIKSFPSRQKTAIRMWLLALLIAGVEGLPFWKTLEAILDFGGTQMKKAMGSANPRVDLGEDLRELLLQITDQPDLILRGASSHWGLGPAHLATLLGAPIPNVDIQGSLGFGSPVQFLDEAFVGQDDPDAELGKLTAAVLGPVGGMAIQAYRQMSSTDPNTWKRVEKSMPVFMKNAMQGGRWLVEGEETFRGEGQFLNMQRPEDRVASVMKSLGFTPTRLSQKYMQVKAQQEVTLFWTLRRQLLLEDFAYANTIGDREAKADAMKAIKEHNKVVRGNKKLRGMGINGGDLSKSLRTRARNVRMRELGIPQSRRERLLAQDVQRLFPVEGEGN